MCVYAITFFLKKAMNLKEREECIWKSLEGGKEREKYFKFIITSKIAY